MHTLVNLLLEKNAVIGKRLLIKNHELCIKQLLNFHSKHKHFTKLNGKVCL